MDHVTINTLFNRLMDLFQPAVGDPTDRDIQVPKGGGTVIALRTGYELKRVPEARAERPNRHHIFNDVESFTNFLLKLEHGFTPATTEILGASASSQIVAVNTATWERDELTLELPMSSAWRFWLAQDGKRASLKALRELLRARRGDLAPKSKSIMADLNEVAVSVTKGAQVQMDPKTGIITFDGVQKNTKVEGAIPSEIELILPIYEGGPFHTVTVDLVPSIDEKDNNALSFGLRLVDADTVVREAWLEQIEKVRALLGEAWLVGIGALEFTAE